MITGEDFERAERVLKAMYAQSDDVFAIPRQLRGLKIDSDDFIKWLNFRIETVERSLRSRVTFDAPPPEIPGSAMPAINTLVRHALMVGVLCGRYEKERVV